MAELTLTFLGSFQATLDGVPIGRFRSDKVRALLAYLVVEVDRPHSRASLCGLLWPDQSEDVALHNLSQTLLRLREALGDTRNTAAFLRISRQSVQWNSASDYRLDAADFTRLASGTATADLERAVALYRGELMPGFSLPGCEAFEEWLLLMRERFVHQALTALDTLAHAQMEAAHYVEAAQYARQQLALDPWREEAHRQLMQALAESGDRAAALATFARCRQTLHDDLGVEPDDVTRALYEQIRNNELKIENAELRKASTPRGQFSIQGSQFSISQHNPPAQPTSFIGRESEVNQLVELLARPDCRLLTLVGPGGIGKTRLAVEVAAQALRARLAALADGVFFVPLAPISTPSALVGAIATALGIALQGGDPRSVLLQMLRHKQVLLILDNFEHLLVQGTDAVDLLVDLIGAAPEVQLLVTSRERLKLRGEHVYALQALDFSATASLEEAAASAAVRLLVHSVQREQADFQLTAANLAAVLRICHLVQGMPLGLELAAANAGSLPLSAIADAIERSAEFLRVDWRDLPERQRSMRAVFAWSWQLLSAEERRILRECSLFRGGFTYSAAQAVTGATPPLLARLTEKSLLQWQATARWDPLESTCRHASLSIL